MSPAPRTPPPPGPAWLARLLPRGRAAVIGVPYLWLLAFFLLPFAVVLQISLARMGTVHPEDLIAFQDGVLTL